MVLESLVTNQSMYRSKSISHVVGRSAVIVVIVYDDPERLIIQGYHCIIHLASGSKSFTLRLPDYLIDKSTWKKKRKQRFLVGSNIAGCIVEADKRICGTKTCDLHIFTLRNGEKDLARR